MRLSDSIFTVLRFNVLLFCVRLFTSIIIARVLGPEAFGVWILLSMLSTLAETFARPKVDVAAIYIAGQKIGSIAQITVAVTVMSGLLGLICTLIYFLGQDFIFANFFDDLSIDRSIYLLAIASIPLNFISLGYAYILLAMENVRAYNTNSFFRVMLPSVLATLLLLTTQLRVEALVLGLFVGVILSVIYSSAKVHAVHKPQRAPIALYKSLFSYGSRLYFASLIDSLTAYSGTVICGLKLSASELAFFRIGQERVMLLDQVPSAVNTMLYPRIANTSESQRQIELTALSIRVLVIILLPITVIGALLLPQMVWVLYGEEFAPLVDVIWLILPGVVCAAVSAPMVQYFIGAGYASKIWKISIIPLLLQLTLLFPMVNNYSFYGAAIVLSLSLFGLSICRLHLFKTLTQSSHASTLVPKKGDFELILNFSRQTMFNFLTSIKIR